MELSQLQAFLEINQWGSFRRAARALHLSQAALSERLKRLEAEVGMVYERTGRGVTLTPLGRALLPHAERVMAAMHEARVAVQAAASEGPGPLLVGSARAVGTYVLPDILQKFRERHLVDVQIRTGRSTEVLEMVLNRDVQLGIARALVHPSVETIPLYEEQIVLVAHPEHRLAILGEADIHAVVKEPLILYDRESVYFKMVETACWEAGVAPKVHMLLDSIEATKQIVERGLGVSFLPVSSVHRELGRGTMARVRLLGATLAPFETAVMVLRKAPRSQAARDFLKVILEDFGVAQGQSA